MRAIVVQYMSSCLAGAFKCHIVFQLLTFRRLIFRGILLYLGKILTCLEKLIDLPVSWPQVSCHFQYPFHLS